VTAFDVVAAALDTAVRRGIRRHDKYSARPLIADCDLLVREIESSFWLALGDAGVELK
jgi:hypothetical protein